MKVTHEFSVSVTYYRQEPTDDGHGRRSVVDRTVDETVEAGGLVVVRKR